MDDQSGSAETTLSLFKGFNQGKQLKQPQLPGQTGRMVNSMDSTIKGQVIAMTVTHTHTEQNLKN